jgi:hypothetical protein
VEAYVILVVAFVFVDYFNPKLCLNISFISNSKYPTRGGIDRRVNQSPSTYHPEDLLGKEKKKSMGFTKVRKKVRNV